MRLRVDTRPVRSVCVSILSEVVILFNIAVNMIHDIVTVLLEIFDISYAYDPT